MIGKVLRRGAWNNNHDHARSAYRNNNQPANRNHNIGFRCARTPQLEPEVRCLRAAVRVQGGVQITGPAPGRVGLGRRILCRRGRAGIPVGSGGYL